jgi:hypothetical protein
MESNIYKALFERLGLNLKVQYEKIDAVLYRGSSNGRRIDPQSREIVIEHENSGDIMMELDRLSRHQILQML